MGFFKKFADALSGKPEKEYYVFQVKCKRCGEIIEGRVDVHNEPSVDYESGSNVYFVRKVLMGSGENHCYQQIEVGLKFNAERKVIDKTISGGEFVDQ
jgi:hypothetical protein